MVLKLWHNDILSACELFSAIRAKRYLNLDDLDCLALILKIMIAFEILSPSCSGLDKHRNHLLQTISLQASRKSNYESIPHLVEYS